MSNVMIQKNGDVIVVYFNDAQILDQLKIQEIGKELIKAMDRAEGRKLLINFQDVKFMASAMLGNLTSLHKKCREAKVDLKLCCIHPDILEVFKITRLDRVFDIYDDEAEAISAFGRRRWLLG